MVAATLGSCTQSPIELRCAAFFDQLADAADPSERSNYKRHAEAFIDRLPGNRAENLTAMDKVGGAIMADDGLRNQCDGIIPSDERLKTK